MSSSTTPTSAAHLKCYRDQLREIGTEQEELAGLVAMLKMVEKKTYLALRADGLHDLARALSTITDSLSLLAERVGVTLNEKPLGTELDASAGSPDTWPADPSPRSPYLETIDDAQYEWGFLQGLSQIATSVLTKAYERTCAEGDRDFGNQLFAVQESLAQSTERMRKALDA